MEIVSGRGAIKKINAMSKYGLISETDGQTLEKVMDLVCKEFTDVNFLEVGIYAGTTGQGMVDYFTEKGVPSWWTGIDNNRDGQEVHYEPDNFIHGNSNEVYNEVPDDSQHIVLIDACHCFSAVISDFFCYAPKVKVGCYLMFHDSGKHIDTLHGWQGIGDKNDPDMCLGGVRKALKTIFGEYLDNNGEYGKGWKLVFDIADPNDAAGGFCCFQKLY